METIPRENKPLRILLAAVYFLIAVVMYYFHEESIHLGLHLMYKYLCALALAGLSIAVALVYTNLPRGKQVCSCALALMLPYGVSVVLSMPLWFVNVSGTEDIRRGLFNEGYQALGILAMAGFVYVFGKDGCWLNLAAMVTANLFTVLQLMLEGGVLTYLQEFFLLVVTFTGTTGPLIQRAEIHELTFALGVYMVYCLIAWEEVRKRRLVRWLFWPALFCYLSGFKRIGAAAILLSVAVYWLLRLSARGGGGRRVPMLASILAAAAVFAYICLVKAGIYEFLSDRFDIDTMGRRELAWMIDRYYWIGPDYTGNGTGFITRLFADLGREGFTIPALHCDPLKAYIELGFWGFWLWLAAFLPFRIRWASRQGTPAARVCLCCTLYVLATSAADNTVYLFYVTCASAITILSYSLR